jgi:hypothetical protein
MEFIAMLTVHDTRQPFSRPLTRSFERPEAEDFSLEILIGAPLG